MAQDLPRTIGRYEVVGRVGRGGMGVVFRARDPRIGRQVAIKLLSVPDEGLRDRFLQEAQSVGSLTHRNIVTIFDYGEHEGQSYIVMEFVEGVTLAEQIHENVPIALWRKLELMEEIASGLDYAHNKGIVHRDIKPANVMTDREGVVKILDFGIARVGNITMTQAGMMLGTPNYMSPEQFESGRIDRRSDIFSVGALFYELLTYQKAFTGEQVWDVLKAVVDKQPAPIADLCPGIDPAIAAAVNRAMEKDPARRYQTLTEMKADLARARARLGVKPASPMSVTVLTPPPQFPPQPPGTPRPMTDREMISKRRAERIEEYLAAANQAIEAEDYTAATEACDHVLLLDPDEPRAHDLLGRARDAIEQQHRRKSVEFAVARAEASMAAGDFEAALRLANEALQYDSADYAANEVVRRAGWEIQQRRERELELDAARAMVDRQKEAFAAGRWLAAIGALERYKPRLDIVVEAIAEMRSELAEIDRRAREEEEEEERRRVEAQQRWVARQLDLARRAIAGQQFADAIEILEHVQRNSPDPPGLVELLGQARAAQAAADEAARRRDAERVEAERRDAERAEAERVEAVRREAERVEAARREAERADAARREAERAEAARQREREAAAAEAQARQSVAETHVNTDLPPIPAEAPQAGAPAATPAITPSITPAQPARATEPAAGTATSIAGMRPQLTPRNLGAVAGALVVILIVLYFAFLRSSKSDTGEPKSLANAPTAVAPSAPPAATPAPGSAAAPATAPLEARLAEVHDRARQQFSRGDWQSGLATVAEGLKLRKDDSDLQRILTEALASARSRVAAERDATTALGRSAVGTNAFKAAVRRQQGVDQLQRSGQTADAIRAAWDAVDLFKQAQAEAQRLAQTAAGAPKANAATGPPAAPPAQAQPAPAPTAAAPPQPTLAPPPPTIAPAPPPVEPTPAARPAPQPAAPAPAAVDERVAIRGLLQAYAAAYSALDVQAVKTMYPGVNDRALTQSFSAMKSMLVHVRDEQFVRLTDSEATVTCVWDATAAGLAGGRQHQAPRITLRLQKTNGTWIIVDRR